MAIALPFRKAELFNFRNTYQAQVDGGQNRNTKFMEKLRTFFNVLQSRARWRVSLNLKTLTLVLADPVMFAGRNDFSHGVRNLLEIGTGDDRYLEALLSEGVRVCQALLQAPHSPLDLDQYPQATRTTTNSWGDPELRFRIADRGDSLPS